tara:strand:- start:63 stop:308 length:246 start_codon:yes stop_codon:yes gene_type:complete
MKINNSGTEQTSEKIVSAESPSKIPNNDRIITCAITKSSITIPSILQIVLHGDDLDANARPLGGGVSGAIMACMSIPEGLD